MKWTLTYDIINKMQKVRDKVEIKKEFIYTLGRYSINMVYELCNWHCIYYEW